MSQIVTYKNVPFGPRFCQLKFNDGNRILISEAQIGIKISRLAFGGLTLTETIFEISSFDLMSNKYKPAIEKLTKISVALDFLDVLKDILIKEGSLADAKHQLEKIFKNQVIFGLTNNFLGLLSISKLVFLYEF